MLTQSKLKEVLNYDPDTGIFNWKIKTCKKVCVGKIAGYISPNGYIHIRINNQNYLGHRLAWLYVYGEFPKNDIDHINNNTADNKIINLRLATKSENAWNRKLQIDNTSGVKGVYWHANKNKWMARIMVNNKQIYLGSFEDLKVAEKVILESRNKYHREFANHGS